MVILVDENDLAIGAMPKIEAHEKARLHRAFSVFIFNSKGELLLQKRADDKYHSAGLWANTCCSHPAPGQQIEEAAHLRLQMEMGMDSPLKYILKFTYKSPYENGLTEHEIDYIFIGQTDDEPVINPDEVSEYKYMSLDELEKDIASYPEKYTTWLSIISRNYLSLIAGHNKTS
ncbi:MAG TPA: isopentenyl-diphosphate delta-isomerase [Dysgonomonas sp.]|nr:isopentenyl-diphosphate delta-isomerase [Dysgonomonas sp.]